MATKADIKANGEWFIGARKELRYPVKDSAGNPVDIDGWPFVWVLMKKATSDEHLIVKDSAQADEIIIENGQQAFPNEVVVRIAPEDTEGVVRAGTEYYIELKRTDTDDVLSYGTAVLKQSGIAP